MQATINVRMDAAMKERGDKVLKELGISPSAAVRSLWEYLGKEKKLPSFMVDSERQKAEEGKARKIAAAKSLIGIASSGTMTNITDQEVKDLIASKYDYGLD